MNTATITIGGFQKSIKTAKTEFDDELRAALKSLLMLAHHGAVSLMLRDSNGKQLAQETHIVGYSYGVDKAK